MNRLTLALAPLAILMVEAPAAAAQVQPPAAAEQAAPGARERARMERSLRQAMWRATRERVGLTDAQMDRLGTVTRQLEPRRLELAGREREARRSLREELALAQPDQERTARFLAELQAVQRTRVELLEEEQRQLAEFMTPVQRARYFAMQEQFRRRFEQLRRPGAPGAGAEAGVPRRRPR